MKRIAWHLLMVLLALITSFGMLSLVIITLRYASSIGVVIYLAIAVAILVWSIVRYRRRRQRLFLTYGIALLASAVLLLAGLLAMVILAMRSFT